MAAFLLANSFGQNVPNCALDQSWHSGYTLLVEYSGFAVAKR